MMNKFEIGICPLCNKGLQFKMLSGVSVYSCPTQVEWNSISGPRSKTHYEVECDKRLSIQHVYVMPYGIDSLGDSLTSRIYKMVPATESGKEDKYRFVVEVPMIKLDTSENLLARIQTLVTFL